MPFSPLYVIVILLLGVLFFGKNLPEVARQIGAALIEFRKGVNEWKEVHKQTSEGGTKKREPAMVLPDEPEKFEAAGTKFLPPSEAG